MGMPCGSNVDDLLAWLDKSSSPLWASLIVVLLLILGVPMSWLKAALSDTIDWIGWADIGLLLDHRSPF